jgi:hypothetical protein
MALERVGGIQTSVQVRNRANFQPNACVNDLRCGRRATGQTDLGTPTSVLANSLATCFLAPQLHTDRRPPQRSVFALARFLLPTWLVYSFVNRSWAKFACLVQETGGLAMVCDQLICASLAWRGRCAACSYREHQTSAPSRSNRSRVLPFGLCIASLT